MDMVGMALVDGTGKDPAMGRGRDRDSFLLSGREIARDLKETPKVESGTDATEGVLA